MILKEQLENMIALCSVHVDFLNSTISDSRNPRFPSFYVVIAKVLFCFLAMEEYLAIVK
jgi:hypothetical protein